MGKKLRAARQNAGLNQRAAASFLSTSQSRISKIELSQCHIDAIELAALAKVYKKQIKYFLS
jgi:transcriptional regulator with XRE-family HTH domain